MRYFDYQYQGTLGRVWSLFSGLQEISEEEKLGKSKYSCAYTHTLDIVHAALNGSLSTSNESIENFNLQAYEYKCEENDKINKIKQVEKVLYIVDNVGDDEDTVGFGDISVRKLRSREDAFEILECDASFEANLAKLYNIRRDYIKERGIDLVSILEASLKGIPDAVTEIAELVSENLHLKELIVSLCEESRDGALIQRLEMAL